MLSMKKRYDRGPQDMQSTKRMQEEKRGTDLEEASIAGDASPGLAPSHALIDDAAQGVHIHPASHHQTSTSIAG